MKRAVSKQGTGFAGPWIFLSAAFAVHTLDEAVTGFLGVYNPTVIALRQRWPWLPMPTLGSREFLVALTVAVLLCFAFTVFAVQGKHWMRILAGVVAVIQILNALGHTLGTITGHTVARVTFPRPAPGFYSSPLLFGAAIWVLARLWRTRERKAELVAV